MNMLALGHKGVNKLALICTLLYCIDTPLYYIEPYHSREAYATMNLSSQAKDTNGIHGVTALLSRSPGLSGLGPLQIPPDTEVNYDEVKSYLKNPITLSKGHSTVILSDRG